MVKQTVSDPCHPLFRRNHQRWRHRMIILSSPSRFKFCCITDGSALRWHISPSARPFLVPSRILRQSAKHREGTVACPVQSLVACLSTKTSLAKNWPLLSPLTNTLKWDTVSTRSPTYSDFVRCHRLSNLSWFLKRRRDINLPLFHSYWTRFDFLGICTKWCFGASRLHYCFEATAIIDFKYEWICRSGHLCHEHLLRGVDDPSANGNRIFDLIHDIKDDDCQFQPPAGDTTTNVNGWTVSADDIGLNEGAGQKMCSQKLVFCYRLSPLLKRNEGAALCRWRSGIL